MKKRLTIIFAVAMLVISCFAFIACSGGDAKLKFELNEDGESYCVVGLKNFKATNAVIPSTYKNKPVTSIGARAFKYCSNLQSIEIPSSVTNIDGFTFYGCYNLKEIHIENIASWCNISWPIMPMLQGVVSIEEIHPLSNGAKLYIGDTEVINLEIPEEVTEIKGWAFRGCRSLQSIEIPPSVTSIGREAFENCNIKEVYYKGDISSWCNMEFEYNSNPLRKGAKLYIGDTEVVNLEIPEEVTEIKAVFAGCSSLQSITFAKENNLQSIEDLAFTGCDKLQRIEIPLSVASIGEMAFYGCRNLKEVYYKGDISSWCDIEFGGDYSNPLSNGAKLYIGDTEVVNLEIPEEVTEIKDCAFNGCSSLQSVTFAEGSKLQSIWKDAFSDCLNLQSIEIPSSITSIGYEAFENCDIKDVYYKGEISSWCNIEFGRDYSNPLSSGAKLYIENTEVIDLKIPEEVTEIKEWAFCGCSSIQSIEIPPSLTSIGYSAFKECPIKEAIIPTIAIEEISKNSLEKVVINGGDSISGGAFRGFSSLQSIEILSSVTSIGREAFDGCYNLQSIEIPSSITSIGYEAFENCNIKEVYYKGDISSWCNMEFEYNSNPLRKGAKLYIGDTEVIDLEIPKEVTEIKTVFAGCCSIQSVTFEKESNLQRIGSDAFSDCTNLQNIEIPSSVTSIGYYAFNNCVSLQSVTFAEGSNLQSIERYAFYGCRKLKYNIKDGAKYLGNKENDYFALIKADNEYITSCIIDSNTKIIANSAFEGCKNLKYNIKDGAKYLGNKENDYFALIKADNEYITSCIIDSNTKIIAYSAFSNCRNLEKVYYKGDISSWCDIEFGGDYSNPLRKGAKLYIGDKEVVNLEIPEEVTEIKAVFAGCSSIQSVSFAEGSNIQSIGEEAFSCCSNLQSIKIPSSVTRIEDSAFYKCIYLQSIEIPSSVTSIGHYAFFGCKNLQSIEIPSSVTSIGESAFRGCSGLNSVTFEKESNLQRIGSDAFSDCTNLQNIEIPSSVTSIGYYAFNNCVSLQSVTFAEGSNLQSIGEHTFEYCTNLQSIEIPLSIKNIGDGAFNGCNSLQTVYYDGTKDDWKSIYIGNDYNLKKATIYYYSASNPKTEQGYNPDLHYWYRDGDEIKIW